MATSKIENFYKYCALSKDEEDHLNKESKIELTCKHHACIDCFMFWFEKESIRCLICNEIETNIDSLIDKNKKTLLKLTHLSFEDKLSLLNERENERQSKINNHCEFITGDIEVKIESLKNELELLKKYFEEELDKIETEWKHYEIDKSLEEKYSNKLCQLEFNTKNDFKKENLQQYYDEIKELEETFNYYKRKTGDEPMFVDSKMTFNKNDIGKLVFESKTDNEIINNGEKEEYETVNQGLLFPDVFIMPDGKILLTSATVPEFQLYDENMKHLKTIRKNLVDKPRYLYDPNCSFTCCAYDGNKSLFFTCFDSHAIMKTDLEFNELARYVKKPKKYQLFWPHGICFYNDHVFVCDRGIPLIYKFDSNLSNKESHYLQFDDDLKCRLVQIKNIKNIALIELRKDKQFFTFFYDLNNFNFIRIYEHDCFIIGASLNKFYSFDIVRKILSCYDLNGEIEKNIDMSSFSSIDELYNLSFFRNKNIMGAIACDNSKMIIGVNMYLLKIKRK